MRRHLDAVAMRGVGDRRHFLLGHVRRGDVAVGVGDAARDGNLDPLGAGERFTPDGAAERVGAVERLHRRASTRDRR